MNIKRHLYKKNIINSMNVVPYIDVMLVLLVIFMITTPMFTPSIINLPSSKQALQINSLPIEISIDIHKHYLISYNGKKNDIDDIDSIMNNINDIIGKSIDKDRSSITDIPIVISADRNLAYFEVINVINILYQNNINKIALVVKN